MQAVVSKNKFLLIILCVLFSLGLVAPGYAQNAIKCTIESIDYESFPEIKAYLSVSSPQGLPIGGLTSTDFTIAEGGIPVPEFEISAIQDLKQTLSFVLVMDISGSMHGKPISDSISAAKKFVENLNVNDEIGVISFADEVTVVQEPVSDKIKVISALDTLTAGGNTVLYDALYQGLELLRGVTHRKVLILVTDGVDSQISTHTLQEVINEAVALGIPVGTIGFGSVDSEELMTLSKATNGISQIQPDSSSLDTIFTRVLLLLRQQYLLQYQSSLLDDGTEHNLLVTVQVQGQPYSATASFIPKLKEITIALPDYSEGQIASGSVHFAPVISSPNPIIRMDIFIDRTPLNTIVAEPFEYNWDTRLVDEGPHQILFSITDDMGNHGELTINLVVKQMLDITIDTPANGDQLSAVSQIKVSADSEEQISTVDFFIDDLLLESCTAPPYEVNFNIESVDPGDHQILVVASDVLGNISQDVIYIEVRPPILLEFSTPKNGSEVRVTADIALDVDAQYGIREIIIQVNNKAIATLTEPPWKTKLPPSIFKKGLYAISAIAIDQNGHLAETEITIEIQGIPFSWWIILIAVVLLIGILVAMLLLYKKGLVESG